MTQLELAELQRIQAETDMLRAQEEYYKALKLKAEPTYPSANEYYDPNRGPVCWVKGPQITTFRQIVSDAYRDAEWK